MTKCIICETEEALKDSDLCHDPICEDIDNYRIEEECETDRPAEDDVLRGREIDKELTDMSQERQIAAFGIPSPSSYRILIETQILEMKALREQIADLKRSNSALRTWTAKYREVVADLVTKNARLKLKPGRFSE